LLRRTLPSSAVALALTVLAAAFVLPFIPAVAVGRDDKEVERPVKQLDSGRFKEREAATKRLVEIGEPALAALRKATDTLEMLRRAEAIIDAIEAKVHPEHYLVGHTGPVWGVSVSADGKRLLTSSSDRTLRLWDADTGKCLRVFEGHTAKVIAAVLSADGRRVLSGGEDRTVRLWDATTGKELRRMTGQASEVLSVAFGPEGKAISGGEDGTMRLWDLSTGKNVGVFVGDTQRVRRLTYSDRPKLAAGCGLDVVVRLWNLEIGKEVRRLLTCHNGLELDTDLCFSTDGKRLLSSNRHAPLRIWDVATGKELKRLGEKALCAAFSPDGRRIASGGYDDNILRLWDAATGELLRQYEGHTNYVLGVAFLPDGRRIASGSHDGTARIWRVPR